MTKLGKNMAGSKVESRASCVPWVFAEKKHIKNDVQKREFHGSRREFEIGVFFGVFVAARATRHSPKRAVVRKDPKKGHLGRKG